MARLMLDPLVGVAGCGVAKLDDVVVCTEIAALGFGASVVILRRTTTMPPELGMIVALGRMVVSRPCVARIEGLGPCGPEGRVEGC